MELQHTRSGWPLPREAAPPVVESVQAPVPARHRAMVVAAAHISRSCCSAPDIERPALVMDGVKVWHPWSLTLRRYCTLGRGVEVYNYAHITLGEQATVSQETYLCSASHDFEDPSMPLTFLPITIRRAIMGRRRLFHRTRRHGGRGRGGGCVFGGYQGRAALDGGGGESGTYHQAETLAGQVGRGRGCARFSMKILSITPTFFPSLGGIPT